MDIEGTLLSGYVIKGERTDKSKFYTNAPMDDKLLTMLQDKNVDFRYIPEEKPGLWSNIFFTSLLPVLLLIGAWFYFLRMQNDGGVINFALIVAHFNKKFTQKANQI